MKFKTAFIILCLIIGAIAGSVVYSHTQNAYAQEPTEDVVYFIDGIVARGTIIQIDRKKIRIRQADGTVIERPVVFLYRFSSKRHFTEIYDRALESGDKEFWSR